jgi:hypothetical protein
LSYISAIFFSAATAIFPSYYAVHLSLQGDTKVAHSVLLSDISSRKRHHIIFSYVRMGMYVAATRRNSEIWQTCCVVSDIPTGGAMAPVPCKNRKFERN